MGIFNGVATALITPFDENGKINIKKLEELINYQIDSGVNGLVIAGTTGEAPTVEDDEKEELFKAAGEIIDGRIPFIAGTGTNNTAHIIKLSEYAQKYGADALLINNPYYNKSSDDGIYANYEAISNAVDVPIIVYNVPSRTGRNISPELAMELTKIKNVKAFKEASGDMSQIAKLMSLLPEDTDIEVYSGNDDQILPVMALGGVGVISTIANIVPGACVELTEAFFSGNIDKARRIQLELIRIVDAMFCECNPIPVKTAMNEMGLGVGGLRLPLVELSGDKKQFMIAILEEFELM